MQSQHKGLSTVVYPLVSAKQTRTPCPSLVIKLGDIKLDKWLRSQIHSFCCCCCRLFVLIRSTYPVDFKFMFSSGCTLVAYNWGMEKHTRKIFNRAVTQCMSMLGWSQCPLLQLLQHVQLSKEAVVSVFSQNVSCTESSSGLHWGRTCSVRRNSWLRAHLSPRG